MGLVHRSGLQCPLKELNGTATAIKRHVVHHLHLLVLSLAVKFLTWRDSENKFHEGFWL